MRWFLLALMLALTMGANAEVVEISLKTEVDAGTPDDLDDAKVALPAADAGTVVISEVERYLKGSEPHSPSTIGLDFNDVRALRLSASRTGAVGLHRVLSADFGRKGLLRFSGLAEDFNSNHFPVQGNRMNRVGAAFAVSYVPTDFAELALSYQDAAYSNSSVGPGLQHAQGDVRLLGRVGMRLPSGLWIGAGVEVYALSGPQTLEAHDYAFGVSPSLYSTLEVPRHPTARLHLNITAAFDDSQKFVKSMSPVETSVYRIWAYSTATLKIGAEWALPWVTPFAELSWLWPLGAHNLTFADGRSATTIQSNQSVFGLGLKLTAFDDVTLFSGMELGLFRNVVLGMPAVPAFNFVLGASYTSDPMHRYGVRFVERVVEPRKEDQRTGDIHGVVTDAVTEHRIPFAILLSRPGTPVASDEKTGAFLTQPLPSGKNKLFARKDGYMPFEQWVEVKTGESTEVNVKLVPLPKVSHVTAHVSAQKKPIAAVVALHGSTEKTVNHPAGAKEGVTVEVTAGLVTLDVSAEGYLAQTREISALENKEVIVFFEMVPVPKKSLVVVTDTKIEILQKIHFAFNKAIIQKDSYQLLDQVVDAIVSHNLPFVRIEGHTDGIGGDDYNQKLSDARAQAVRTYLVKSGISPNRLSAKGFGRKVPIDSNKTAKGRERNRRVEFIIAKDAP